MDPLALERASEVVTPERDHYGILRFRTSSEVVARGIAATMKAGGYGVDVLKPSETYHKMWAVSCWGDYMMTSDGPVPI